MSGEQLTARSVWVHDAPDPTLVAGLSQSLRCPEWYAGLLIRRGLADADSFTRWTSPKLAGLQDPLTLPDIEPAIQRILVAIERGERITIFGDYDVDGITASALMHEVLSTTPARVSLFIPQRLEEGYGLSVEALKRCVEETAPDLIITVDCGTSSRDAVLAAAQSGIDVVITDHHAVSAGIAPAIAVVNPRRSPDEASHVLAGVGVAFKVCHALLKRARQLDSTPAWADFDIKRVIDLVTLGTVADMVPLTHENRIFVSFGLREINRSPRPGIKALADAAGLKKRLGTYEIGFTIAPRLNAAGRLGTALASLELLTSKDPARLRQLAGELNDANRERQEVEKATVAALLDRVEKRVAEGPFHVIVEADREWHPGVVGLAATRATQRFGRPSIVIGCDDRDRAKGSGRSISGFNLVDALDQCREHLVKHGGHSMAAGLEIAWNDIEAFRMKFEAVARQSLKDHDFKPRQSIDGWLSVEDINDQSLALIQQLEPFGMGNPEPVWAARDLVWHGATREVGKGHLKGSFRSPRGPVEFIGFGLYRDVLPERVDVAFALRREEFMGREKLVMNLKDLRVAGS